MPEDPERVRARARAWARANPERLAARNAIWRENNRDRYRERQRRYQSARRAQAASAPHLKFSEAELAAKLAYWGARCWICGGPWAEWDHVKPLSKGGYHCLANLRPACSDCNNRKNGKWPFPTNGYWRPGNHEGGTEKRAA